MNKGGIALEQKKIKINIILGFTVINLVKMKIVK